MELFTDFWTLYADFWTLYIDLVSGVDNYFIWKWVNSHGTTLSTDVLWAFAYIVFAFTTGISLLNRLGTYFGERTPHLAWLTYFVLLILLAPVYHGYTLILLTYLGMELQAQVRADLRKLKNRFV